MLWNGLASVCPEASHVAARQSTLARRRDIRGFRAVCGCGREWSLKTACFMWRVKYNMLYDCSPLQLAELHVSLLYCYCAVYSLFCRDRCLSVLKSETLPNREYILWCLLRSHYSAPVGMEYYCTVQYCTCESVQYTIVYWSLHYWSTVCTILRCTCTAQYHKILYSTYSTLP